MGTFLRNNWLWIVAPIVLVFVLMVIVILLGGGDDASPFVYNL
jgi:uncharacterized protein DUF5989